MAPSFTIGRSLMLAAFAPLLVIPIVVGDSGTTTFDYFSSLKALPTPAPNNLPPGGQDFTRCCLQAVQEWKDGNRADISIVSSANHIFKDQNDLSSTNPQFPCGASYIGDDAGAPQVLISYNWCASNCGGWQKSHNADLAQWIIPFVGFILPAAVFCLNVPRRMVFDIADDLFPYLADELNQGWFKWIKYIRGKAVGEDKRLRHPVGVVLETTDLIVASAKYVAKIIFRAGVALALGLTNVVVWVIIVFSTAGPMMLSGLYEAAIDRQVLRAMEREILRFQWGQEVKKGLEQKQDQKTKQKKNEKSKQKAQESTQKRDLQDIPIQANQLYRIKYQVHLLYAILIGNLELKQHSDDTAKNSQRNATQTDLAVKTGTYPGEPDGIAWRHVRDLLATLKPGSQIDRINNQTRLNTMLECQSSFGAAIGAPIAFFLGAFLLSIFSNNAAYGNNDDSHTLAFGEWWMTIPHIAIVSGCLLAGNNPNTLEAIYSGIKQRIHMERDEAQGDKSPGDNPSSDDEADALNEPDRGSSWNPFYKPFYTSIYQPVWMWERGRSKREWIKAVQQVPEYKNAREQRQSGEGIEHEPDRQQQPHVHEEQPPPAAGSTASGPATKKPFIDRLLQKLKRLWLVSRIEHPLKDVPALGLLGWTVLILTSAILIIVPWVLAYITSYFTPAIGLSCRSFTFVLYFLFQLWLTFLWFIDFNEDEHRSLYRSPQSSWPSWYYLAVLFGFAGSAFASVAGTFMQIVGVYRNCKCFIPISAWASGNFVLPISSNSADMIYYAKLYWLGTGVASIVLLLLFCYLGWWYQRHWRNRFNKVVEEVLMIKKHTKQANKPAPAADEPASAPLTTEKMQAIMTGAVQSSPMAEEDGGESAEA